MANHAARATEGHVGEPTSNAAMVEQMKRSGAIRNMSCIAAFRAVDRGSFWSPGIRHVYADRPLRDGPLHQSAPHIYARALEALLPLTPGLSFFNIGSGTGYFSAVVSEIIGEDSVNDGLEVSSDAVSHAKSKCKLLGKQHIQFTVGNIFQLDIVGGMRYDRIYIGSCADQSAAYLISLLEVGGILVGPFQVGFVQQLQRIVRQSETLYKVEVLNSVQFVMLQLPPRTSVTQGAQSPVMGIPGVPFTFVIRQRPWTLMRNWSFPRSFRWIAAVLVRGSSAPVCKDCPLPSEIWLHHILPWCDRAWFEQPAPTPPVAVRALAALAAARERIKAMLAGNRFCIDTDRRSRDSRTERTQDTRPTEDNSGLLPLLAVEQTDHDGQEADATGDQAEHDQVDADNDDTDQLGVCRLCWSCLAGNSTGWYLYENLWQVG